MKCELCNKRKGIIRYSDEPVFAMTHGFAVTTICRQCYIIKLEAAKKGIEENIQKQKRLLKTGQVGGTPLDEKKRLTGH